MRGQGERQGFWGVGEGSEGAGAEGAGQGFRGAEEGSDRAGL